MISEPLATTGGTLGRYEIVGRLGQGAMGVVYKARDPIIDRIVALKTIDPHLSGAALREFNTRFFHEAQSAGRLSHPNIVTIYDAGDADGIAYIAMEYVEGPSIRQILDDHPPLALARILEICAQVARGLGYAHEQGIVHRDIKPANVLVGVRRPKITDFGIARMTARAGSTGSELAGSPKYMSPEQVRREELDGRSDIFSLGTVLYELLTGKQPFTGETFDEIVRSVLEDDPPPPSSINPRVPEAVDRVVTRMMAKRPEDRYVSARRLMRHLAELSEAYAAEEKNGAGPSSPLRASADLDPRLQEAAPAGGGEDTTVVIGAPSNVRHALTRRLGISGIAAVASIALVVGITVLVARSRSPDASPPAAGLPPAPQVAALDLKVVTATPASLAAASPIASDPERVVEPQPAPVVRAPSAATKAPLARPRAIPAKPAPSAGSVGDFESASPDPTAAKGTATLQLAFSPWGEVFINGESRGASPPLTSLQVPPGTLHIEVRNASLPPYRVDLSIEAGDTRRIKHRFE